MKTFATFYWKLGTIKSHYSFLKKYMSSLRRVYEPPLLRVDIWVTSVLEAIRSCFRQLPSCILFPSFTSSLLHILWDPSFLYLPKSKFHCPILLSFPFLHTNISWCISISSDCVRHESQRVARWKPKLCAGCCAEPKAIEMTGSGIRKHIALLWGW